MKVDFFKPEDFGTKYYSDLNIEMAKLANAKLEREGHKVYAAPIIKTDLCSTWRTSCKDESGFDWATKTAFLINIQPIKKCEHPKEKLSITSFIDTRELKKVEHVTGAFLAFPNTQIQINCECGAKVEPTAFQEIK